MAAKPSFAIACDHAGYPLKEFLKNWLTEQGHEVKDFGAHSEESVDYPDFAHPMSLAVEQGEYVFGLTVCGSGNGITMAANKHQGIRAAYCWNPEIASLARQHNDANVVSMPGRYLTNEEGLDIMKAFLEADYEGGRHQGRVDKIPV